MIALVASIGVFAAMLLWCFLAAREGDRPATLIIGCLTRAMLLFPQWSSSSLSWNELRIFTGIIHTVEIVAPIARACFVKTIQGCKAFNAQACFFMPDIDSLFVGDLDQFFKDCITDLIWLGATILLWLETRRSVNITRHTFENSFQPIVTIAYITDHPNAAKKELAFSILIANFGNVPAVEVEISSKVFADNFALAPQKQQFGTAFIPPHSDITTTFVLLNGVYERARKVKRLDLHFSVLYEGIADEKYQHVFTASTKLRGAGN